MRRFAPACCLLVLMAASAFAQNPASPDSARVTTRTARSVADTLRPTVKRVIDPKKATLKSLMLPGLGQVYIGQWWAVPVIYGGFGTLGFFVYYNQIRYKRFLNAYAEILPLKYKVLDDGTITSTVVNANATVAVDYAGAVRNLREEQIISTKNFHRRNRDLSYIGIAALWGMNVLQTNVSAHLKTFDDSDDISLRLSPGAQSQYAAVPLGATLTLNFSSKPPKSMKE